MWEERKMVAPRPRLLHQTIELLLVQRIQAAGRLIQHEEARVVHEGEDQAELLLVAPRVLAEAAAQVQIEPPGECRHAVPIQAAAQPRHVAHHLATSQAAELRQLARQEADQPLHLDRPRLAIDPKDLGPPARRPDHIHEKPDRGRLARPVRAQVAEHLSRRHLEVQVEQTAAAAVVLGQTLRPDRGGHRSLPSRQRRRIRSTSSIAMR